MLHQPSVLMYIKSYYVHQFINIIRAMDAMTDTEVQKKFKEVMNQVCDDHAPIIITRESEPAVVMMSLEDYNSIQETLYLLRSPKNAERLTKALHELKEGRYEKHNLIDFKDVK